MRKIPATAPEHKYNSNEGDFHGYAASTPASDGERLYIFFGRSGVYCLDLDGKQLWHKTVGRGDVTKTHVVWRLAKGSNVASPVYHDGRLYWAGDGGRVFCQDAETGKVVYDQRLDPNVNKVWASPVLADGKLYYVTRDQGTYVVAAGPKFELLAHNVCADDMSRSNASIAISDGQILLRTDENLYCIGK